MALVASPAFAKYSWSLIDDQPSQLVRVARRVQRQAHRRQHFVSQRLPLGIPEREQVADGEDGRIDRVCDRPQHRQAEPDWLPGVLADDPEPQQRLADAGSGGSLAVAEIPDEVAQS